MELTIENNLDKECGALSGLFEDIMYEMKSSIPNFDEFAARAGKLHATLKNTLTVLSSFLDSFQKIADAASSTKGNTRDIGTCLTRIVIRHRALESRMKTLAGALMDCLAFPIQGKSEEWKKSTVSLEKEHMKCYKKNRSQIKKKTDQVLRLKKKLRKERIPDPSLQRLFDQCSKDLNIQFKNFEKNERHSVRRALTESRNHYCTFVAFLKPVFVEEMAMFTEIYQIEEILNKLNRKASQKESSDTFIEEYIKNGLSNYEGDDSYSLYISTPTSNPMGSSMGSRNASMSSLESSSTTNSSMSIKAMGSPRETQTLIQNGSATTQFFTVTNNEKVQTRPNSSLSLQNSSSNIHAPGFHQPCSTTNWDLNYRRNSHCFGAKNLALANEDVESTEGDSFSNDINDFSTVKRTYSPFYRVSDSNQIINGVYMSQRCSSAERSMPTLNCSRQYLRCMSSDRNQNLDSDTGPHYATPKPATSIQSVPNFHPDKGDMVIPHPIYMNCADMEKMKMANNKCNPSKRNSLDPSTKAFEYFKTDGMISENELKTPTVEDLSISGQNFPASNEDGSSSSSDSFGSSSGYGSQYTIKLEENSQSKFEGQGTLQSLSPRKNPRHNSNRFSNILDNRAIASNLMNLKRRSLNLKFNHSFSKGHFPSNNYLEACNIYNESSIYLNGKPVPPIRGSSMSNKEPISSNDDSTSHHKNHQNMNTLLDEDITPRGSIENISGLNNDQNALPSTSKNENTDENNGFQRTFLKDNEDDDDEKVNIFCAFNSKFNKT